MKTIMFYLTLTVGFNMELDQQKYGYYTADDCKIAMIEAVYLAKRKSYYVMVTCKFNGKEI